MQINVKGKRYTLVILRPCEWDQSGRPSKAEIGYSDATFRLDDPAKANEFITAFVPEDTTTTEGQGMSQDRSDDKNASTVEAMNITVWKDGSYLCQRPRDDELCRDDPDWLCSIPLVRGFAPSSHSEDMPRSVSPLDAHYALTPTTLRHLKAGVLRGCFWTPFYVTKIREVFELAERALTTSETGNGEARAPSTAGNLSEIEPDGDERRSGSADREGSRGQGSARCDELRAGGAECGSREAGGRPDQENGLTQAQGPRAPAPSDKRDESSLAVMTRFIKGATDKFARTGGFSFVGESAAYWLTKFAQVQTDLACAPSEIPSLTKDELEALIDYHDWNDAGADAMDMPESAEYHSKRSKAFQAMRDALMAKEKANG